MAADTEVERLVVRLMGDGGSYQEMLRQASASTKMVAADVKASSDHIQNFGFGLRRFGLQAIGALGPITGLLSSMGAAFKGVQLAAASEETEIAFGTMLGSMGQGKTLVKRLQQFAAETPLDMSSVQHATRTLLQFGIQGDQVLEVLKMLGDVSGGDAQKLFSLSLAFGQMTSAGRLMGQDLLQMINAGFNPLQEISRTTGKSVAELRQTMEAGGITTKMVFDAFKSATSQGGAFNDMMLKMSKTATGLFSTMKDDINALLREVGRIIIEFFHLKDVMRLISQSVQVVTEWIKGLSPEMKNLVAAIAAVAAVATTLALAWPLLAFVFEGSLLRLAGIFDFLLGPVNLLGMAAIAFGISWMQSVGGVEKAFEKIKEIAQGAWEWFQPILDELKSLGQEIWITITEVFGGVRDFLLQVWAGVAGDTEVAWDDIRAAIVGAVQAVREWLVENRELIVQIAKAVATFLLAKAALDVVGTAIGWVKNAVVGLFTTLAAHPFMALITAVLLLVQQLVGLENMLKVIVTAATNLRLTWQITWVSIQYGAAVAADWIRDAFATIVGYGWGAARSLARFFTAAWQNIRGIVTGESINMRQAMGEAFAEGLRGVRDVLGGGTSPVTRRLRNELDGLLAEFGRRMEQRGTNPIDQVVGTPQEQREREEALGNNGRRMGESFNKNLSKEMQKAEAAVQGSAEALGRIAAQRDRVGLQRPGQAPASAAAGRVFGPLGPGMAVPAGSFQPGQQNFQLRTSPTQPLASVEGANREVVRLLGQAVSELQRLNTREDIQAAELA